MDRGLLPSPEEIQKIIADRELFRRQAEQADRRAEEERRRAEEERRRAEDERRRAEEERRGREEERRGREDAERRIEEERRGREEERQGREEERQRRIDSEAQTKKTAFIPYLYYCYACLFQPIRPQKVSTLSSSGSFTDVKSRFYPRELRPWVEFPSLHDEHFMHLSNLFESKQLFSSLADIKQVERDLSPSPLAEEQDLRPFELAAVELRVRTVISEYLRLDPRDDAKRVIFRSNPYSLQAEMPTPWERADAARVTPLEDQLPDSSPARGSRGEESRGRPSKRSASSPPASSSPSPSKKGSPERRSIPDRWCIRQDSEGVRSQLFVIEYKAAHKLTPETLRMALDGSSDMTIFANAVRNYNRKGRRSPSASPRETARNRTAQVLTQAFHYMVDCGLAHSYVTSGEGTVFLYIDQSDPTVLYYHLALPKDEIVPPLPVPERPVEQTVIDRHAHLMKHTPVALVLTLILLSLKKRPLSFEAKAGVRNCLKRWGDLYDVENTSDTAPGEPRLPERVRLQPIEEESNTACKDPEKRNPQNDDDSSSGPDSAQPRGASTNWIGRQAVAYRPSEGLGSSQEVSKTQLAGKQSRIQHINQLSVPPLALYCTQQCLLGLKEGRLLDESCPNVALHRRGLGNKHHIDTAQLHRIIQQQLCDNLDDSCEALDSRGKFGAIGALFKVTARPYGYTLVTKGVQRTRRSDLSFEAQVYSRLSSLQGTLVPVCLGLIDLARGYVLGGGAYIQRMMLMSYGGETAASITDDEIHRLWETLIQYGVEHEDLRQANILWNTELGRFMVIDFDRAILYPIKRANSAEPEERDLKRRNIEGNREICV
jgi:hypothetical protein